MNQSSARSGRFDNGSSSQSPPTNQTASRTISNSEFERIAKKIYVLTGIVLPLHKRELVIRRLRKRLPALNLNDFEGYLLLLESQNGAAEAEELINAITTNLTSFFRENHHFDDLKKHLAELYGNNQGARRVRIWSTACSTGEEPYSVIMSLLQARLLTPSDDLRLLATDLDTNVLDLAKSGIFPPARAEILPRGILHHYFKKLPDGRIQINGNVRRYIQFNQLNLHDSWQMSGQFDFIFCRNVLIYFDADAKRTLVDRMVSMLALGGTLYLGHSEGLLGQHPELNNLGQTIFRKTK